MKFERVQWSNAAERKLLRAMKYMSDIVFIRGEVLRGVAILWECDDGAAYMVTRAEGDECVIVCYEGERLHEAAESVRAAAQRGGFKYLRWHSQNPAINRMLKFLNPEPLEYVMRAAVNGQQVEKFDHVEQLHH